MSKINFTDAPFRTIVVLYVGVSFLFSISFLSPYLTTNPLPFVEAWFLSVSAISTTGLATIDIASDLTIWGQAVLLLEIQIGGVGIMVILGILLSLFKQQMTLSHQTLLSVDQNQKGLKSIKQLMLFIGGFTLVAECIGFCLFYGVIRVENGDNWHTAFLSLFQSVGSFTGAGFDLFGGDIQPYATQSWFLIGACFLIILGSIGFPTVLELVYGQGKKKSLYTKVNLSMHGLLIITGFVFFFLAEFKHSLHIFSLGDKAVNALFLSVTSRNAGMSSLDLSLLSPSSLLFLLVLMFIGGSASSSAGGIRVTTFATLLAKLWSVVRGKEEVVLFKKSLYEEDINKSYLVFSFFFGLFGLSVLLLSFIEQVKLEHLLFEVMSALTTTGLSIGITDQLSPFSLAWLSLLMIIGRIGIIAIMYVFIKPKKSKVKHTKESLIVG